MLNHPQCIRAYLTVILVSCTQVGLYLSPLGVSNNTFVTRYLDYSSYLQHLEMERSIMDLVYHTEDTAKK